MIDRHAVPIRLVLHHPPHSNDASGARRELSDVLESLLRRDSSDEAKCRLSVRTSLQVVALGDDAVADDTEHGGVGECVRLRHAVRSQSA